jgi:hypothetical protein
MCISSKFKFEIRWVKPSHVEFAAQWYYEKKMEEKKRCFELQLLCIKRELNPRRVDLIKKKRRAANNDDEASMFDVANPSQSHNLP